LKRKPYLTPKFFASTLLVLFLLLFCSFIIALLYGSEKISPSLTLSAILNRLLAKPSGLPNELEIILFTVRLPRAILAIVVGASLSVAGAALQALLRNPLAEPYVLGVSSGAALGAVLSIILIESFPISQPFGAFMGAALTILVVYLLGQGKSGTSTDRLILAGVITTSFLWAAIIFFLTLASSSKLKGIAFWLMGDLSASNNTLLFLVSLINLTSMLVIFFISRSLNLLMVGEESALSLGVSVEQIKIVVYLLASLLTGATVALVGSIGYIGLIVPHLIRMAFSSDYRLLIPSSALLGASLLLLADTIARTLIAPRELPVGAITALLGAPLFVYLLRRST
jgi:iron complex transport system permease protein